MGDSGAPVAFGSVSDINPPLACSDTGIPVCALVRTSVGMCVDVTVCVCVSAHVSLSVCVCVQG